MKEKLMSALKKLIPCLGLIILIAVFSLGSGGKFLELSNLQLIVKQTTIVIIVGYGATFVMGHGNMDLSLGGILAISSIVGWMASKASPILMIPVCIITGVAVAIAVGWVHIALRVPYFIVGLCTMFIGKGTAEVCAQKANIFLPSVYAGLDQFWFYLVCLIVVFVIGHILLEYTKLGRYNKMIGANAQSAELSGIPINRYKMYAFMASGVTVGIGAFLSMVRTGGVTATTGSGLEMDVIIGLVLGGVSLSGGPKTKMYSIILGSFILTCLSNGLILVGVNPSYVNAIKALVFLGSVYFAYGHNSDSILV